MAKSTFDNIKISAIVTTVGDKKINLDDEKERFGFDDKGLKRLKKSIGLESRYVASDGVCTTDLCYESAKDILDKFDCKDDIEALLFVTQSADYKAPSSAIIMQDRLGLPKSIIAYDINLGCSGFVMGLFTAYSFINSGLKKVLLLTGDVNRAFSSEDDKAFAPLMGDAGSAILIEKCQEESKSEFIMYSDGSGYEHLIVPAGGCRVASTEETRKKEIKEDGCIRSDEDLVMNGKEVFNFAVKTVPPLIEEILESTSTDKDNIDYYVLHQANKYILQNIQRKLGVDKGKVPLETGVIYGNQNSASIPGTINGFLSEDFETRKLKLIFAGFGIGLSWGAVSLTTDSIYTPKVKFYSKTDKS
jgi:3-oxoacyl-[acyl-carrier-protein] synthase-3